MAIDVIFSEISSPRISFSHDLNNKTDAPSIIIEARQHDSSTSDFDFCIGNNSFLQELSSADELFSNGRILPMQIKKQQITTKKQTHHPHHQPEPCTEKKRLKELLSMSDLDDEVLAKPSSKSFWQFKRSSSLNCESTRSKSLIRSLQFLSRSNSTGSAPNPKPTTSTVISKESQKQNLKRQPSVSRKSTMSTSSSYSGTYYYSSSTQKPPLKKCGSYNGHNGVRISPVLNIPPPFISNATVSLFGFGSLFCNGKVKKKKR